MSTGLREAFDALFIAPFATHRWESKRAHNHWADLEGWQDSIAGPVLSVVETGGCEYVYARDDWYFAEVDDPESLRTKLSEWLADLSAGVERFVPTSPEEDAGLRFMRDITSRMGQLIEQACAVEQSRWSGK